MSLALAVQPWPTVKQIPPSDLLAYGLVTVFGLMLALGIRRRRDAVRILLLQGLLFVIGFLIMASFVQEKGVTGPMAVLFACVAGFVAASLAPKRTRYIPAATRRKAIARFELTGKKYNPRKHELDHDVPYSKGGSSTDDNLRVMERGLNRRKGAKSPWWDLLGS